MDGITLLESSGNVGIVTTTPAYKLDVNGSARVSGNLTVDSNLTVYGTIYGTVQPIPSSRRFKTNIQTLEGSLAKVERLRGVTFDWKESGKHDIGVIAEEVGEVVPEVVAYEANGVDAKGVDYARLTALLIEAVKEQQAQIRQLQSEMEGLKARLGVEVSQSEPRP